MDDTAGQIAKRLGAALDLPVVHLDRLYLNADWTPVADEVFDAAQVAAVDQERSIIDGGYTRSRDGPRRLRTADLIVVAEAPLIVCLWRVASRRLRHDGVQRADRPENARDVIQSAFLRWIVTFHRRHPDFPAKVQALGPRDAGGRRLRRRRSTPRGAQSARRNRPTAADVANVGGSDRGTWGGDRCGV